MSTTDESARETLAAATSALVGRMRAGDYPDACEEILGGYHTIWMSEPCSLAGYEYGVCCVTADGRVAVGTVYRNRNVGFQGRNDEVTVDLRDLDDALRAAAADVGEALADLDLFDEEDRHWAHMDMEHNRQCEARTSRLSVPDPEQPAAA